MRVPNRVAWLVLLLAVAGALAFVFIPVYLIQPFAPQTPGSIEISYLLRSWSPIVTVLLAFVALAASILIWVGSKRWFGKAAVVVPLVLTLAFTWFARQNHFEWMFNPLGTAQFAQVSETDFVRDDEMVLAVKINGDAVAFPVSFMAYHHIAQAVVGGTPITATY